MRRRTLLAGMLAGFASASTAAEQSHDAVRAHGASFALIGDIPYNGLEEIALEQMFAELDPDLDCVIHVGDIKRSSSKCSDALFERRLAQLDRCTQPLIYLPGDNEWVDCAVPDPSSDPLERLAMLRSMAFARPESLGRRRLALSQQASLAQHLQRPQSGLPENLRWHIGNLLFISLNIQGSLDGVTRGLPEDERRSRMQANFHWLAEGFDIARRQKLPALVIACHADPRFGRDIPPDGKRSNDPHLPYRIALRAQIADYAGQVLFVHGDSHLYRADQPFSRMENPGWGNSQAIARLHAMQRVECFGSPFAGNWVRIDYRPGASPGFVISPRTSGPRTYLIG